MPREDLWRPPGDAHSTDCSLLLLFWSSEPELCQRFESLHDPSGSHLIYLLVDAMNTIFILRRRCDESPCKLSKDLLVGLRLIPLSPGLESDRITRDPIIDT